MDQWLLGDVALSAQTVEQDAYDARTFQEARSGKLARTIAGQRRKTDDPYLPAAKLAQDMFASFYKKAPALVDETQVDPGSMVNREIMEEVLGTQEWADLRAAGTTGDPLLATIATTGTLDAALDALTHEQRDRASALAETSARAEQLQQLGETLSELADQTGREDLGQKAGDALLKASRERILAQHAADALAQDVEGRKDAVRRAARPALKAARQEVEALLAMEQALGQGGDPLGGRGWGPGSGAGANTPDRLPLAERVKLAERLKNSADLAKLAALCGRMLRLAFAVRESRVEHAPAEVTNVRVGSDINRLLPSEMGLLSDDSLEGIFFQKYTERALLEYELIAHEKTGRGPIVLAEDESASMGYVDPASGHSYHQWSKAVALALAAIARHEKRDFCWLHFASSTELVGSYHHADKPNPALLLKDVDHNFMGGTSYDGWMAYATELATQSRWDKADVILLTDGEADVSPVVERTWHLAREQRGMRCYTVRFGAGYFGNALLDRLSDAVFPLADLTGDGAALAQVFAV